MPIFLVIVIVNYPTLLFTQWTLPNFSWQLLGSDANPRDQWFCLRSKHNRHKKYTSSPLSKQLDKTTCILVADVGVNANGDARDASLAIFGQPGYPPKVYQNCYQIACRTGAYGGIGVCGTSKTLRQSKREWQSLFCMSYDRDVNTTHF